MNTKPNNLKIEKLRRNTVLLLIICIVLTSCKFSKQVGQTIEPKAKGDYNGYAIAMSKDGSIIATSAPYNDDNGIGAGNVRVFKLQGNKWVQLGNDILGKKEAEHFGISIDMSDDGKTIVVGAPNAMINGLKKGKVRVYTFKNNKWMQVGKTLVSNFNKKKFGTNVRIDGKGTKIAISSPYSENSHFGGAIETYRLQNNEWVLYGSIQGKIFSDLYDERNELIIGTFDLSKNGKFIVCSINKGSHSIISLYEFEKEVWQPKTEVFWNDRYKSGMFINYDGTTIAVNNSLISVDGYIKVFTRKENQLEQKGNTISVANGLYNFNKNVALSDDGNNLIVINHSNYDAYDEDNNISYYTFKNNKWLEQKSPLKYRAGNYLEHSVAVNANATRMVIGQGIRVEKYSNNDSVYTKGLVKVFDIEKK